jgi:hypothetical protein
MAGAAYRTFSSPVKDVYEAVHETFQKLEITPTKESFGGDDVTIQGVAIDRKFTIKLDPITPTLTRMKLVVSQHGIGKDRATSRDFTRRRPRARRSNDPPARTRRARRIRQRRTPRFVEIRAPVYHRNSSWPRICAAISISSSASGPKNS